MSELTEEIIKDNLQDSGNTSDELEDDFEKFVNGNSEHTIDKENKSETTTIDFLPNADEFNMVEDFKVQIFAGIFFSLLDELHFFIYKFMSKHDLKKEDLSLDEDDQEGLQMYFKTKRVLDLINKLPVELIGFIHVEWIYYQKFRDATNNKKDSEQEKKLILLKEFEERKKAAPKKAVVKKRPAKKKAVKKKAAPKKQISE